MSVHPEIHCNPLHDEDKKYSRGGEEEKEEEEEERGSTSPLVFLANSELICRIFHTS